MTWPKVRAKHKLLKSRSPLSFVSCPQTIATPQHLCRRWLTGEATAFSVFSDSGTQTSTCPAGRLPRGQSSLGQGNVPQAVGPGVRDGHTLGLACWEKPAPASPDSGGLLLLQPPVKPTLGPEISHVRLQQVPVACTRYNVVSSTFTSSPTRYRVKSQQRSLLSKILTDVNVELCGLAF